MERKEQEACRLARGEVISRWRWPGMQASRRSLQWEGQLREQRREIRFLNAAGPAQAQPKQSRPTQPPGLGSSGVVSTGLAPVSHLLSSQGGGS